MIRVNKRLVTYTESLVDNKYTIKFEYTKRATAHTKASKIKVSLDVFFHLNKGNFSELSVSSTLYTLEPQYHSQPQYRLSSASLYKNYETQGNSHYISLWVSANEVNHNNMTDSVRKAIHEIVESITEQSKVLDANKVKIAAKGIDTVSNFKQSINRIREAKKELIEAESEWKQLLELHELSQPEVETILLLVEEGAHASDMLSNIKKLLA